MFVVGVAGTTETESGLRAEANTGKFSESNSERDMSRRCSDIFAVYQNIRISEFSLWLSAIKNLSLSLSLSFITRPTFAN